MDMRDGEIIKEGLHRAISRGQGSLKTAMLYIDELARFLAYGCDESDSFIENCREYAEEFLPTDLPVCARSSLMAGLCKSAVNHLASFGKEVKISDFFEGDEGLGSRIAYVKNSVADEAYMIFSRVVENASVTYSGSFAQACEDVYYGRVAYCILPYETSDEGALSGFMKLIRKYELYPHFVCVCGGTRLALLGRTPCSNAISPTSDAYLKLTFYRPESDTLLRLSAAIIEFSLTTVRSESFPVSFEDGLYGLDVTLHGQIKGILPLLIYLALEIPECSDKALYRQIY